MEADKNAASIPPIEVIEYNTFCVYNE